MIDALLTDDTSHVTKSSDWVPGFEVIIPTSIGKADAKEMFRKGRTELRHCLRTTTLQDCAACGQCRAPFGRVAARYPNHGGDRVRPAT